MKNIILSAIIGSLIAVLTFCAVITFFVMTKFPEQLTCAFGICAFIPPQEKTSVPMPTIDNEKAAAEFFIKPHELFAQRMLDEMNAIEKAKKQ